MVDRKLDTMRRRSRALEQEVLAQRLRLIRVNSQQSYQVQRSTRFSTPVTRKAGDHDRETRLESSSQTARRDAEAVLRRGRKREGEKTRKTITVTDYGLAFAVRSLFRSDLDPTARRRKLGHVTSFASSRNDLERRKEDASRLHLAALARARASKSVACLRGCIRTP